MASLFFLITSGGHSGSLAENSIPERRVLRSLTFPQQLSERIQINGTDIRSTPNQSRLDPKIDISLFSGTWKESPRWNRIRGHRITFKKKKKFNGIRLVAWLRPLSGRRLVQMRRRRR